LSVTVTGTGFTTGARAVWALDGDTTLVHVKSTKVMGSTQLVAQLVIPLGAPVASYDIQVLLVDGKKGVGADLFTVTSKDPTAQFSFPLNDAGLGVKSDHLYVAGDQSVYAQAICGVDAKIFATTQFSNSGDAVMQTNNKQWADRACANYPRKISIDYGDGTAPQWTTIFMNVRDLQRDNVLADQMPVGTTRLRGLNIQDTRCGAFVYMGTMADGTSTNGADSVLVTRTSATTWLVQSQPAPNDKMYCKGDGKLYHVPVQFTVIRNLP
jgi:hypothetical protein